MDTILDFIFIMLQVPRTKPSSESIEEKHKFVVFAGQFDRITKKKECERVRTLVCFMHWIGTTTAYYCLQMQ